MKNKSIIVVMFSLLILLAGCTQDTGGAKTSGKSNEKDSSFVGGTEGLNFELLSDTFSQGIRDKSRQVFSLIFKVDNLGEYNIESEKAKIRISGTKYETLGIEEISKSTLSLPQFNGVSRAGEQISPGMSLRFTFSNLKYTQDLKSDFTTPLVAYLCYPYETYVITETCLDNELISNDNSDVCEVKGDKKVTNSGSPIQVVSFSQSPLDEDKLSLFFKIRHVGNGNVFKSGSLSECNANKAASKFDTDKNKIKVEFTDNNIKCINFKDGEGNSGEVQLYNNEVDIHCEYDTSSINQKYNEALDITLKYDYVNKIQSQIKILSN